MFLRWGTVALLLLGNAGATVAMTIRDDVFEENGGTEDDAEPGFAEHVALANKFPGLAWVFINDELKCSATYLAGGHGGRALFLTAAHCYESAGENGKIEIQTRSGKRYKEVSSSMDELWPKDFRGDMAVMIVEDLDEDMGEQPYLYCGRSEVGKLATITGGGLQGTGELGYDGYDVDFGMALLAGHNMIDGLSEGGDNTLAETAGLLAMDFDDGTDEHNALADEGSDAEPVDRLEVDASQGDSGGSVWIDTEMGPTIVGVNSYGSAEGKYGSVHFVSRTSDNLKLLRNIGMNLVADAADGECYDEAARDDEAVGGDDASDNDEAADDDGATDNEATEDSE